MPIPTGVFANSLELLFLLDLHDNGRNYCYIHSCHDHRPDYQTRPISSKSVHRKKFFRR